MRERKRRLSMRVICYGISPRCHVQFAQGLSRIQNMEEERSLSLRHDSEHCSRMAHSHYTMVARHTSVCLTYTYQRRNLILIVCPANPTPPTAFSSEHIPQVTPR